VAIRRSKLPFPQPIGFFARRPSPKLWPTAESTAYNNISNR
jgi:hypothetical protein